MSYPIKSPKKLIEVALPLDAINTAAAREKSIRHGHPSTLHLWWARRPLAAARAVIFAQLVNDPGFQQGGGFKYGKNKKEAAIERKRLFGILEELVKWESTTNEEVLEAARAEIRRSWREVCELNKDHPEAKELFDPEKMPGLHDPFAGGGTIPLEAQRLGLDAFASDLNPVAVLINKAMIEIPPKFAGKPPVHPDARKTASLQIWRGAQGLADDVRRYGAWMRDEAATRVEHLYPKVLITPEMAEVRTDLRGLVGNELTVIAWLWARTVRSPNPAFSHVDVPLVSTFVLSAKEGHEAFVEPLVNGDAYSFRVKVGQPPPPAASAGTKAGRGSDFRCILSGAVVEGDYIKGCGRAGRLGARLLAVIAYGPSGRVFLPPTARDEEVAASAQPQWQPDVAFFQQALGFRVGNYGMTKWSHLFTARQLTTLCTLSDIVREAHARVHRDAETAWTSSDLNGETATTYASSYADAICTYLSFAVDKVSEGSSTLCTWSPLPTKLHVVSTFGRQALPITWDYAEANVFADSSGNILRMSELVANALERQSPVSASPGVSRQVTATRFGEGHQQRIVSTDPPYYDNIGYADLSDFFYVWLRRSLRDIYPELFATVSVPKSEELVATPARHGGRELAQAFFLEGMKACMARVAEHSHPAFPVSIYYAFKQAETTDATTSSTGWETFLEALISAGLVVTGTWPVRTERSGGFRERERNSLASSIVLLCRQRDASASTISRRDFLRELNSVLPEALDEMTKGSGDERSPIAPVDLSQAIIGPGMAAFSKHSAVLEADGSPMSVKTALQLINRFLAEDDFDHDTQFCLHWFDQYGWGEGAYGEADVLARAKATSVSGLDDAGVLKSGSGKVRLLRPSEYPSDWDPKKDPRIPIWEALHQLIRSLRERGESGAGQLLATVKGKAEAIRQLAYRLYTLCERRGWADDARAYNELVTSWSAVESVAGEVPERSEQLKLFGGES